MKLMHRFNKGHLQSLSCLLPKCLAPSLFFTSLQFLHTVKLSTNMIIHFTSWAKYNLL